MNRLCGCTSMYYGCACVVTLSDELNIGQRSYFMFRFICRTPYHSLHENQPEIWFASLLLFGYRISFVYNTFTSCYKDEVLYSTLNFEVEYSTDVGALGVLSPKNVFLECSLCMYVRVQDISRMKHWTKSILRTCV